MKRFFSLPLSRYAVMGSLLFGALLFASCTKRGDNNNTPQVAGLMAFNLAPDKAAAGFALSGNNLTPAPLQFSGYTGAYLNIYPGTRTASSYDFTTGSTIDTAVNSYVSGKYYSMFLTGANGSYRNVIVSDNVDSLSGTTGQAYVRYINAIPDSSSSAVTLTLNGNNVISENASFRKVSGFTAVAPGDVVVTIGNNEQTIKASRTITLEAKKVYTLLFIGLPGQSDATKAVQIKYIANGQL